MAVNFKYDKIIKYEAVAVCTQPLHIGSAVGDKEEVLIHPVDDIPFIQATSIAGVFRNYYEKINKEAVGKLFGEMRSDMDESESVSGRGSRLRFTDGIFLKEKKGTFLELRPRVSINPISGSCEQSIIKGTNRASGHKFNMEYIGAGAEFKFCVYLYDISQKENIEEIFAAIHQENISFGGQKSNGCGSIKLEQLYCKVFDMKKQEDRMLWKKEDELEHYYYEDILSLLKKSKTSLNVYDLMVEGETEGSLLVKSIGISDYGKDAPKCENIRNAKKEYIIPGSSFKGAIRSQMSKIAFYLHQENVIENTFGTAGNQENQGKTGNIRFFDTVVGDREENDMAQVSHRIHIDKFTGGVMHGGIFTEKNVAGKLQFKIGIEDKNEPEKSCGILLMALRDLAIGTMNIGSGYNVGKGIIKVKTIRIQDNKNNRTAVIDFETNQVQDEGSLMKEGISSVQRSGM